jgi:hypothetical protein
MHSKPLLCIDAYGTYSSSYPPTTVGVVLPETNVTSSEPTVLYSPSTSWNTSSTVLNCTSNASIHVTSTTNATISFNYTGEPFCPTLASVMLKHPQGRASEFIRLGPHTAAYSLYLWMASIPLVPSILFQALTPPCPSAIRCSSPLSFIPHRVWKRGAITQ